MKSLLFSTLSISLLLLSGCSQPTPQERAMNLKEQQIQEVNSLPKWITNPQSVDGITAVGMSAYSRHGIRVMKPQAEMDARAKLAGQIQTLISRSQKQALRSVQIENTDDMENIFSQSTEELIKEIPLSGAVIVNQKMTKSGDYYVQMIIKKRELIKEINEDKKIYEQNLKHSKLTREGIEDGMKVLDKMMDELDKDIR